ncbi:MAG: hypothetical protein IJX94_04565, partial [Clostridia bacterium]|nr:hypothetical protein [Clostridia bacterium]
GLILAVFDASRPLSEEDLALAEEITATGIPTVALLNKIDREESDGITIATIRQRFAHTVAVSAAEGDGFDRLAEVIDGLFIDGSIDMGRDAVVTGARQYAALTLAAEALESALADLRADLPLDLCCVGMEHALTSLGEVDGRELGEEIVAEIFSRFCVGK